MDWFKGKSTGNQWFLQSNIGVSWRDSMNVPVLRLTAFEYVQTWKCIVGWSGDSHFRTCGFRSRRLCTRSRMRSSGKKTTSVSHDVLLEADGPDDSDGSKSGKTTAFHESHCLVDDDFKNMSHFCCFEPQTCLSCLYNINKFMVSQVLPAIIRNAEKTNCWPRSEIPLSSQGINHFIIFILI